MKATGAVMELDAYRGELYTFFFESIRDAVVLVDQNRVVIDCNPACLELFGYSRQELVGQKTELLFAEKREYTALGEALSKQDGNSLRSYRITYRRKTGETFIGQKKVQHLKGRDGEILGFCALIRDVTEEERFEEELRTAKNHFEHLFRDSPLGILLLDRDDRVVDCNHEFTRIFQYKREEIIGKENNSLIVPESKTEEALSLNRQVEGGRQLYLETVRKRKDGTLIDVAIIGKPIKIFGGEETGYGIYQDISDRKSAEREIGGLLKEKDLLLREVHHRIKNNMATIASLLSLQANTFAEVDEKAADVLQDAGNRVQSMVMVYDALFHSKDFRSVSASWYLGRLIESVEESFGLGDQVRIEQNIEDMLLDSRHLFPLGIISNELLTNSIKYAFPHSREGLISISLHRKEKNSVEYIYQDNGVGIPEEQQATKITGFGLSLVEMLCQQLDGSLERLPAVGAGYRIIFPL